MDTKTKTIADGLSEMICTFKGSDFKRPTGDLGQLSITDDFEVDSLDLINLLFEIEQSYGVKIPAADLADGKLLILASMAAYIADRR